MVTRWIGVGVWLVIVVCIFASAAMAKPIAAASEGGLTITLTDEPCKLAAIANLQGRAIWREGGKDIEGCYGLQHGLVAFYWADKTVVILPMGAFRPLTSL